MIDFTKFHGMVLYEIELNGCLNGVYTNNDLHGKIFNEIAKKTNGEGDGIAGEYTCSYVEKDNSLHQATITIRADRQEQGFYAVDWFDLERRQIFMGIGFKMNEKQFVVYYQKT